MTGRKASFRLRFAWCGLLLAILSASAHAQTGADDDEILKVDSSLVLVNVTVTDATGKYVGGLKREDFRIFEDGKEQSLDTFTTFGTETTPFAAAILLDTSGSMEMRMSLARAAAIRFLDGLRDEDVAAVYHFDSKIKLLQEFSYSRDLAPVIFDVKAKGTTALNDALVTASRDLSQRAERRRALIVLSDGADNSSSASTKKALEEALAANVVIYTVDMNDPNEGGHSAAAMLRQNSGALKELAEKSGGRFIASPGGKALRDAFAQIVEELRHQYTIGYRPINRNADGRWRALEVRLTQRPELAARARKGYRVPKK